MPAVDRRKYSHVLFVVSKKRKYSKRKNTHRKKFSFAAGDFYSEINGLNLYGEKFESGTSRHRL